MISPPRRIPASKREPASSAIGAGEIAIVVGAGPNGLAGEWGHNPLPWAADDERPGAACFCGHSGCIETWLSGPGMARDHTAHTGAVEHDRTVKNQNWI